MNPNWSAYIKAWGWQGERGSAIFFGGVNVSIVATRVLIAPTPPDAIRFDPTPDLLADPRKVTVVEKADGRITLLNGSRPLQWKELAVRVTARGGKENRVRASGGMATTGGSSVA